MSRFQVNTRILSDELDRVNVSTAELLAISCSDFRFIDIAHRFLEPYTNDYDQIVIPGASGAIEMDGWKENILEQIDILIGLHDPSTIWIMDHQDCGLYKALYGKLYETNMLQLHREHLLSLRSIILKEYPYIQVEMFLFLLNGTVLELV